MRKIIYQRLYNLRMLNNNFSTSLMKFRNAKFNDVLIADIPFGSYESMDEYSNEELLNLFERIIRLVAKQT